MGYATAMAHWDQLAPGLMAGITAIVFGLVPGLPQAFVEGFLRLSDALPVRMLQVPRRSRSAVPMNQPRGFALFGLAIIAATLFGYLVS
jgi:hypothetical protein